jgi:hypothetical protein
VTAIHKEAQLRMLGCEKNRPNRLDFDMLYNSDERREGNENSSQAKSTEYSKQKRRVMQSETATRYSKQDTNEVFKVRH